MGHVAQCTLYMEVHVYMIYMYVTGQLSNWKFICFFLILDYDLMDQIFLFLKENLSEIAICNLSSFKNTCDLGTSKKYLMSYNNDQNYIRLQPKQIMTIQVKI